MNEPLNSKIREIRLKKRHMKNGDNVNQTLPNAVHSQIMVLSLNQSKYLFCRYCYIKKKKTNRDDVKHSQVK